MHNTNTRRGYTQIAVNKNCHSRVSLSGISALKRGFTLIELLVVVLIIGILAAIAVPQYQKAVAKARAVQALTGLQAIVQGQEAYYLANGEYDQSFTHLDIQMPSSSESWAPLFVNSSSNNVEDNMSISVYKQFADGPLYFSYYVGSKEYVCMCDANTTCALCESFPHVKKDCHEVDKSDGFSCYYL